MVTWWFGPFYTGSLDELIVTAAWKPSALFNLELDATHNAGRLREGAFTQNLIGVRARLNLSPDLQFNSYVQYDDAGSGFGMNTRVRWTFSPLGDLFLVYNHNLARALDPDSGRPVGGLDPRGPGADDRRRWEFASNQLLVKLQYAFRY